MTLRKPFLYAFVISLGFLGATSAIAWTGPSTGAPNGNAAAPINVSSSGQTKTGGLILNSGGATNGLAVYGRVGFGTPSPVYQFDLKTAFTKTLVNWNIISSFTTNDISQPFALLTGIYGGATLANQSGFLQTQAVGYGNGGNLALQPLAGNVGVGTITPAAALQVYSVTGGDTVRVTGPQNPQLSLMSNSGATARNWGFVINNNYFGDFNIQQSANNTSVPNLSRFTILDGGNVGIGNINPGQKLDVAGAVQATAFYYSSDERLKKNIEAVAKSSALQDILALKPVTYNWIDPAADPASQLGFIAQQVEAIAPELVTTNPATGMKSVDYARAAPLLVGAIQAQQAQIDELKAEMKALKAGK